MQYWREVRLRRADYRWNVCLHQLGRHQLPREGFHRVHPAFAHSRPESDAGLAAWVTQDDAVERRSSRRGYDFQRGGVADSEDRSKCSQHRRPTTVDDSAEAHCQSVEDKSGHQETHFR